MAPAQPSLQELDAALQVSTQLQSQTMKNVPSSDPDQLTLIEMFPNKSLSELETEYAEPAILSALAFAGMDQRYETIPIAHTNTFSWIFRKDAKGSWDSFVDWLETGENIYWMNGKAASGKSTLMRYVLENEQLHTHLNIWRGSFLLATAKFYFWATGSKIQKSQIGLFRSILHQILYHSPSLIRDAFPDLLARLPNQPAKDVLDCRHRVSWKSWTLRELKDAIQHLLERTSSTVKYCFVIDGLDEFDGDFIELTSFFKDISKLINVKLCLSSRPLLIFDQQLGQYPKLRLQDLTVEDITRFVRDKLIEHPRFREISIAEELGALQLIDEIVQRSLGVFLWVNLVVKSIVQGLTNHDGIEDLRRRLRELPPELDELYSLMLSSISPDFYEVQGAKLLQLVYQSPDPISVLELYFADESDNIFALSDSWKTFDHDSVLYRAKSIVPKMKSRCAGLLEADDSDIYLCAYSLI